VTLKFSNIFNEVQLLDLRSYKWVRKSCVYDMYVSLRNILKVRWTWNIQKDSRV